MPGPTTRRSGSAANTSEDIEPPMAITITLHLQDADGTPHHITGRSGRSLMQAAVDAGLDGMAADCGGGLSCATCHVMLAPDWLARLPAASSDEEAMLAMTAHPREAGSRLSCQIRLTPELNGLQARLPPTQY
jgi:ferredoxin, 2Fe-2S